MVYVYVLKSQEDNGLYIGCTNDLKARINEHINSLIIMTTLFYKIPPHLPFPKGGKLPLFGRQPIGPLARRAKRGQGRFCGACQFNFETLINSERVESTKNRVPVELIYYEACLNRSDAFRREKYLKTTYGRRYLKSPLKNYFTG